MWTLHNGTIHALGGLQRGRLNSTRNHNLFQGVGGNIDKYKENSGSAASKHEFESAANIQERESQQHDGNDDEKDGVHQK